MRLGVEEGKSDIDRRTESREGGERENGREEDDDGVMTVRKRRESRQEDRKSVSCNLFKKNDYEDEDEDDDYDGLDVSLLLYVYTYFAGFIRRGERKESVK